MRLEDVIRSKGHDVVTITPTSSVTELVALLAEHNIGAVVVSTDGRHLEGIVSERDVVRALFTQGAQALDQTVALARDLAAARADGAPIQLFAEIGNQRQHAAAVGVV